MNHSREHFELLDRIVTRLLVDTCCKSPAVSHTPGGWMVCGACSSILEIEDADIRVLIKFSTAIYDEVTQRQAPEQEAAEKYALNKMEGW